MDEEKQNTRAVMHSAEYTRMCAVADIFRFPSTVFSVSYWYKKIKVYRRFSWLFVSAGERAQKVRRNCKRVDTQSDRRAFV